MQDEVLRNQLRYYLGMFWVQPSKDKMLIEAVDKEITNKNILVAYQLSTLLELKQFAQRYIMKLGHRVNWVALNTYEIVEQFIQSVPIDQTLSEAELLIVYHGIKEIPNRQIHNIPNGVISNRYARGKPTLLLSIKEDHEFLVELKTIGTGLNIEAI